MRVLRWSKEQLKEFIKTCDEYKRAKKQAQGDGMPHCFIK
jgi:hypothetical protein